MLDYNKKKSEQLGMPFGTASNRLRKLVLFELLRKYSENVCFQCYRTIETVEDLSIEHKVPWLDNNPDLFWDLDNVAYSHISCNIGAARRPNKKEGQGPEGTMWCFICKDYLPEKRFGKDYHRCLLCNRKRWENRKK